VRCDEAARVRGPFEGYAGGFADENLATFAVAQRMMKLAEVGAVPSSRVAEEKKEPNVIQNAKRGNLRKKEYLEAPNQSEIRENERTQRKEKKVTEHH
jgi:hypothetical protein